MHPNNPYAAKKPDFAELASKYPSFAQYVTTTDGFSNIDWQNVTAVRALNTALLKHDWNLDVDMKEGRLCPPRGGPDGRLDYIYHLLDLVERTPEPDATISDEIMGDGSSKDGEGEARPLRVVDIGTGAMTIYPILLHRLQPKMKFIATEKDHESLIHARQVLITNNIPAQAISILEVPPDGGILFPLLDDKDLKVDMTMCNPPFYSSTEELQAGVDLKMAGPHAAASGAYHELVCDGGEAAFVGQMITESQNIGSRCTWFTSLIGRYASLQVLVSQLRREKIDNYYIIPSQPAKTVRWILIWSHTYIRLPDDKFRSSEINPTLLPPAHVWKHDPDPPLPISELQQKIIPYLISINIKVPNVTNELELILNGNTWSRAARRKLKLQQSSTESNVEIPIRIILSFTDGKVEMKWIYGRDRADVESFWNSMLAKSGLITRSGGEKRAADGSEGVEGSRKAPRSEDEKPA